MFIDTAGWPFDPDTPFDRPLLDPFRPLYDTAGNSPGVTYHGWVPQPALAAALRGATMLAYPNTFAETSCIAVMEAMAGRSVVSSDLGALPETGAGFIEVTPPLADPHAHAEAFADRVIRLLADRQEAQRTPRHACRPKSPTAWPRTTGRGGPSSGVPGCPCWSELPAPGYGIKAATTG